MPVSGRALDKTEQRPAFASQYHKRERERWRGRRRWMGRERKAGMREEREGEGGGGERGREDSFIKKKKLERTKIAK